MNAKAISEKKSNSGCFQAVFGLIFFAAGVAFLWVIFLSPLIESLGAQDWPQADCRILKSEIKVKRDSDGDTYKPIVEYQYIVAGRKYHGDRPTFEDVSASRKWAKRISDKYPVGSTSQCFYDPQEPGNSVLDRDYEISFYLMALFPLVFVGIGAAIFFGSIFGWKGKGKRPKTVSGKIRAKNSSFISPPTLPSQSSLTSDHLHAGDLLDQQWSVPKRLLPSQSRWGNLIGLMLFAGFWNTIVSCILYGVITDGKGWFEILFLVPFVLVGIGMLLGVVYAFLAIFNPKVEVALSTGAVAPGESVDIAWEVKGNANKFKSLKILARARQSATYRRGTDTYIDDETFELIPILETSQTDEMEFGSTTITIPADTMHTFEADNNQITWEITVNGDIPWLPDVEEWFEFRVKPS